MKYKIILLCISAIIISGCTNVEKQKLMIRCQDESQTIKLKGPFTDACRAALEKFGSINTQLLREIHINQKDSYKATFKAKDSHQYEYIIAAAGKDKKKLTATLITTSPYKEEFLNAVYEEFNKREFEVEQLYVE